MRFLEWLNRCLGKTPPAPNLEFNSLRADSHAGLELVRLEERIVLNVDAGVSGSLNEVLEISLDAANDEATVSVVDGGATIQVNDGLNLPDSIMQFNASQINSILVTGVDPAQTVNFLGQNDLIIPNSLNLTGFSGDVNIGIEIQVGTAGAPEFSASSTVTYLGQYDRVGDQLNVVLQNQLGADDSFAVQINGTDVEIIDQNHSNTLLYSTSLAGLNSIHIQGADGETDLLSLNYGDSQLTQLSISFDGGLGGNDTLEFFGGTFDTITHHFTGPGSGSVDFSGNAITEINYSGLEPVFGGNNTANNVEIELPTATTDAVLENAPLPGEMQIRSLSSSFELTTFASPADSLKITTDGGNSIVYLNSYDTTFTPTDLILSGQASDTYQLAGSDLLDDSVSLTLAGGAILDLGTFNETVDQFTLEDGTVIASGGILTAQSDLNLQSGSVKAQLNGTNLIKNGSETVILDALNGYTGTTTINDGTLQLAQSNAVPNTSSVDLASVTSVLDLDGFSVSLTSLTGTGSVLLGGPSGSLTLNQAVSTTATFGGGISGDGSLTIGGAGEVILSGNSSFTGATNVQDGVLKVDGTLATSKVTVATGATLGGSGSVNAPVTINADAALAPGSSPGFLSTGDLTLDADGNLNIEINGTAAGTQYDQIQVTGEVDLTGAKLNISSSFTAAAGDQFLLIQNDDTDSVTGEFVGRSEGTLFNFNGNQVYISYVGGDGNDVVLVVNTPPSAADQSFSIDENTANTTSVGTIAAADPNVPPGDLTFSLTGGSGQTAFNVSTDGEITVADINQLDYETTTSFELEILVTDDAGATDTVTITINLNPVNDNTPVVNNQILSVDENTTNGTNVGAAIPASDADLPNDSLTFSKTGGTGAAAFDISSSGQITVADQSLLDYETTTSFDLEILVTDAVGATDTATITINLNPVNDNSPVVLNQIRNIDENSPNGTPVGAAIVASDADLPNDSLTFTEVGGSGAAAFNISSSGQITVADQSLLDYETTTSFTLDIMVSDGVNATDTATITINLNPLNDNIPVITNQIRDVDENSANGTLVGAVLVASDADQPGDTLTFSEAGGTGAAAFDITAAGQIVVADQSLLNFETNPTYTLDVIVDDNAGSTATATVTINLNDLVESMVVTAGNWSSNDITIIRDGSQIRILETGTSNEIVPSHEFDKVSSIIITGNGSDNTVRLDMSVDTILPPNGISFDGAGGSNTLVSADQTTDWLIDGTNSGSLLSGAVSFSNVENLTGNAGADNFVFQDGGQITGTLSGGNGSDSLDFSAVTSAVNVDLQNSSATGLNQFGGIEKLSGDGTLDSISGLTAGTTYLIDGVNQGSVSGIDFDGFSHVTGSTGIDTFQFSGSGQITGSIDGLGGSDILDYSASTFSLALGLLSTGTTDGFTGSETSTLAAFDNIDSIQGSGNSDTLTGINAGATWTLDGANQYSSTNTLSFSGFENLTGGTDVDSFNITGSQSLNLAGNSGNDVFAFADGASLTGTIDGQAGADQIDYSALTTSIDVVLTANGSYDGFQGTEATISGGFDNINNVAAGSGTADKLTGQNAAATWSIQPASIYGSGNSLSFSSFETLQGGSDVDQFNINGSHTLDLLGGLGNDVFSFNNNISTLNGLIDGQGGSDHLNLVNYSADLNVTLSGLGSTDGFDGTESAKSVDFANIDQLTGGSGTNSLTGIDSAATWTLNGTNTYVSTNSLTFSSFVNLTGGSDTDIFNVTPDSEAFNITGGDPISNPLGDQLNVDTSAAGTAVVSNNGDGSGSVTGSFPTVTYSEIENFAISGTVDVELDGTANADDIEILVNGGDIEYRLGGILIGTSSLSDTTTITVKGGDGDDSLTVDAALATAGITVDYDGEGQDSTSPGDVLNLLGTTTSVEYFFTDSSSGSIRIDGSVSDFITYSGLEPITSTINTTNVTLNYSSVAEIIAISDAGSGQTQITSTAGETLTFTNPSGLLTINTGDGADQIELNSLAANFTASLTINGGGATDTLNANCSLTFASGKNVELNVESINVANSVSLTAASIAFNAETVDLDGDLIATTVSGDAATVNVLGSAGGADIQDAVDIAGTGGIINIAAGVYHTAGTLDIDESVSLIGAGKDVVEIRKVGAPTNNYDIAVNISANDVSISGAQLGWETHTSATDYQGYVVYTIADNTTLNNLLFGDNYRSAVVFEGANNLEVSDSIFEGKYGRAAIRDGDYGSGENFLITRNEFRETHFRWGPIAIGPQGTYGDPNNYAFSGEISFNYFGNGLEAGAFQEAGDQNYTVTITNRGMTADGIDINHNTFDWQDSSTTNGNGIYAQPGGVYFDPSLAVPVNSVNITNNIFNGFSYEGPQPTTDPLWHPADGVFGGALEFDGVDDFGVFQSANFDVGESGTLSFWVNMDDQGRRNQFFEGPNNGGMEFQYRTNGGGQFFGSPNRNDGNGNTYVIQDGGAGGTTGVWQNIQYTWDYNGGVNPEMHLYIDGVEVDYFSATYDSDLSQWTATVSTINELMSVGRDPGDSSRYFDGMMDDVGWFDQALGQTDLDTVRTTGVSTLSGDSRLVAHWDFDQSSGDIAVDNVSGIQMYLSTNGIVPFGPEFQETAGVFGGALQFDGIDDFATFQDSSFDVGKKGTLNFWIKMDDTGRRNQFFEGPDNGGFEFQYRTNGGGQFYGRTQDGGDYTIQSGGFGGVASAMNPDGVEGDWTNIQYTWDADTGEMHIYINGSEAPYLSSYDENLSGFDSTHFTDTINGLMNVGRDPGDSSRFFDGLMDDIGWFNDVLDSTDRATIMNTGVASLTGDSRLVAHWNLDDPAGTTVVSGDSGTNITLYLQAEPPLPPIEGFGVLAPLNANVTYNAFNGNDLDSNVTLDSTNTFGDPLFAYANDPSYVSTDSLETQFTIGFGSSAAYGSSEFAADTNTNLPHIGAYQNQPTVYPGVYGSGDIVVYGTGDDDQLVLTLTGEDTASFVLTRDFGGPNETILATVSLTDITSITFNGLGGDDVLIINQPDNLFFNPSGGIIFNGGSQNNDGNSLGITGVNGDTLVLNHSTPLEADSVAYVFTPDSVPAEGEDGNITISDSSMSDGSTTITFTGLEPILDNLLVANRDFDFTDADETISLSDDGVIGDNYSLIDSTLSESVLFLDPTSSITIRTDSVGTPTGVDTVLVNSLDSLFDASLSILAGDDDPVTFQSTVDLVSGDLYVTAESVNILADIDAASVEISSSGVTSTTLNGGTVTTTGSQLYHDAVNVVTNTTLTSTGGSSIQFDGTIDGAIDLEIDTTGTTIFNGAIGSNAALSSLTTNAGGTTQINGGSIETTGDQIFNDDVELGANAILTSTSSGAITFNQRLNGTYTLEANTDGDTTFNDTVGDTNELASLTTDANGTTYINGGSIATTGGQLFNDTVLLGANTILSSSSTGTINFKSTLNGAYSLNINTDGTTIFDDQVGNSAALVSLTTDANGTTQINGGSIETTGDQIFHDAVELGANTILTSTSSGAITFDNRLNGGYTLEVNTDGDTTFNGTVGDTDELTSLTTDANGTTYINGGSIATSGGQLFNDAVMLGANTILSSSSSGTIQFASTLNGAYTLNIDTDGTTIFDDVVGNSAALVSLTTNVNGTTQINGGSIQTTGDQIFHDDVELGANTILISSNSGALTFDGMLNGAHALILNTDGITTFNSTVGNSAALLSLTTDANGTTHINGGSIDTTGAQIFHDNVELGANTSLTSTSSGALTFDGTLNGAFTLNLNTDGLTTFNSAVGNSAALVSLTTDANGTTQINGGSIETTGDQIFHDDVELGANTTLTSTSSGAVTFDQTLNGSFTLEINTAGDTTFNGTVGNANELTSLTTDADGATNINGGSIATSGGQLFNDTVLLGVNTVLSSSSSGTIQFVSTLDGAYTLNINTDGTTIFDDQVGNSAALVSLTTNVNGTTQINGGSIETTGDQIFNDDIELGANTILTSTGSGAITFDNRLNGGYTLEVNTDGDTTFNGTVGDTDELTSLTTDANGTTYINGGSIATSDGQLFNDAVMLGANTILSSSSIGTIQFASTLDGAHTLEINTAGTTIFDDLVGDSAALTSLTTDAAGDTQINGGAVTTTGSQIYYDTVELGANTVLTSTASGAITFDQSLDGTFTLNVNTDGITTFNGTVGNGNALVSLTTDAGGTTQINGGTIETTGDQIFHDDVELGANTTLTSTSSGAVTFDQTLNGTFTLEINTAGDTTFNGTVGNANELTSLTTDADGTTNINGGSIATSGGQLFNDTVLLGANTVLSSSSSGSIQFVSTLNGAYTLNINTDGTTIFDDQVGNSAALVSLTTNINGTTQINGGSIETTGDQIFNDDVELGANTILTSTASGAITFNQRLNGIYTLEINTDGDTTFNNTVGDTNELVSLTTDANGTTNVNGGSIATTGGQLFNDAVMLGADTVLSSSASGTIQFKSTLNGAYNLNVNTDGTTIFDDQVGNSSALTSLTTDTNGTTEVNGGSVTTTGGQTYHDVVTLGVSTVFTSTTADDITFDKTLTGGSGISIDISSTNDVILKDAVSTDGAVTITADSDSSTAGDVTMESGSSLDAGTGTIDIDGANVTTRSVTTTNGSAAAITIDANNGDVITKDGGVNALGDIAINATGTITLEDDGVNTGEGGSVTVQAGSDVISTGTGIDTTNGASAGGNIQVTSNTGKVDLSNGSLLTGDGGGITVNAVTGFTTLNTSLDTTNGTGGGSVEAIASNGTVSVTGGGVTVDGAGTVQLTAKGTTSDIQLDSSLTSADGSITLRADNDIALSATTSLLSQGSGNITLTADNDGSNVGSITMDSGSRVESQGGQIQLSAAGDIALSGITTTGGRVDITSTLGGITDNDSTGVNNVTASQLVLNSKLSIGQLADAIDTAISFLEADAGTGGLFLDNTGALTIGGITAQDGLNADQDIVIHNTGTLDVTETVQSSTGSITLDVTDTLTVDLATTISTLGTGAILLTSTRNIKLNSGSNLKTVNGGITLLANDGGVTAGDFIGVEADKANLYTSGTGNITITGFGGTDALTGDHHGVYLHSGTTISSSATGTDAGTITINGTAGGGINDNYGVFIDGASTNVTSTDGDIDITGTTDAGVGFMLSDQAQIVSNGTGVDAAGITINGSTTADRAGVEITSLVQSTDGAISITGDSTGGGTSSEGTLIQTANGQVLNKNGQITINGTSNGDDGIEISNSAVVSASGTGNIELLGESSGTGSGINLDATLKSNTGTVTLTAEDDLLLGSVALIDSTSGTVTLTADNAAGSNGNPITMIDGALIDAGTGEINLTADGDVLLGGLLTTGTVNIDSLSASISDNGDSHTDIVASTAVLNAVTGIGDGNPLENEIGTLSATVSSVGNLMIDNGIAVELLDLSTFDGAITVNNTASITATSVVSQNDSSSDSNDITLTATGTNSDILVTTITATGVADVILTADDGILDTNGADSNRITADDLNMSSSSAGGTQDGIDVDTDVNSVTADVNTNAGGIRIDEVDGITLTQLTTFDGFIMVNAAGTIEVLDVTSTNNSASDTNNGITLTATGADSDILVTTLTAQNTADITLNADRDVLDSDSTDSNLTSGDLLTIVAGRNIGGITNVFTADGFDPLQTSVNHMDLTSGDQIVIDNTGTTPELINLDAGTGTAGTTYVRATGGALDASTTTGISNTQDTISFISDVSVTVPTGLQTANLRLDAPDIIDAGGGAIDINAVNSILFKSDSAETVNITAQQFDGTALGSDFVINNDSPALELVDLNTDGLSLTGGTDTNIALSSAGSITVTNLVQTLGTGTLFLETTNTDADLILNHNLLSDTGSVTISTANDIQFNGTTNLTSTSGSVMLTADADNGAGGLFGGITMADGTYIDAGDGAVSLTASDDITLSQIITTNNTNSAIQIDTDSSLIDSGDSTGEDLIANETGARVTIVAALGAGKAGDLNGEIETKVDQINITNQTSGEIRIIETDDLIVHDIIQSTAGDIEVYTTGDILLNGLIETVSNNVILDSKASIIDQNDGIPGELNIHATSLDMNAVSGIGVGDTLELSVDTFSADTTDGDVLLHNTATTGVTATSITTGTGNIELAQVGNESLALDLISTNDGAITVSNEGDAQTDTLTLTSISAGGATPAIDVSTINFGNILLGDLAALDGSISVTSAGEINDAVDDQVSPEVDLNAASGSITLEAINGIGNSAPVELSAGTLSVNTSTGNIDLNHVSSVETGSVTVTKLTTGTGSIDYEQTEQQSAKFEEISTTDSDITLNADGSLLFENPGVLQNVISTDGIGTIQVTATGVNSSIEINDGFSTAGGTIDLTAQNSLNFGSDGDLSSADGKITLLADSASAGAGGGGITMSDGTVFDAGTGILDLQAGDSITVGQLFTTTLTRLTSTDGGIVDAGDTGGRDITADELAMRTATGAGSEDALETAVSLLAANNTDSGSIQVHNDLGGALLTIGTVDGLAGVTNAAGVAGDINISNASPLTVDSPVINSSGGNIDLESTGPGDLTLNASVRAFGGNGNINLEAGNGFLAVNDTGFASDHSVAGSGVLSGHGDSGVLIDANTTLNSETGAIAGLPPDLRNLLTPQILPTGLATVTGDFGRFTEQNFFITIDWGDGTVETFNFSDPGSFVFQHTYTTNPDPQDPSADIPILVTMQGDKQFTFSDGNGSLDFTSEADLLETPGEGLATVAIDTTPQVPQLIFPRQDVILDASSIQQIVFNIRENQLLETAINEANKNAERLVFLRILAPNGDVIEDVPLDESDLDNLPKLFSTLPDGRYQIYLKEAGEERVRLLMDVDIRNGKASDVTEERSNAPTAPDQQKPGDNNNNTQREDQESRTVTLRDLEQLTTVVMTDAGPADITDRIDLLEQFLINETAEWQTILPREPQTENAHEHRTLPLPAEATAHLETSDKAWGSAALLSGYFHGRSLFRKPATQVECETALEKYGSRLLNRRYKLNRRQN
ncbi:Extracellular serine protease precursor [Gimesia panareensis]|uniref:Extracellular serine protease n=1 Tax=Gimesia panareensis TaxID=2527978 RepID=A0A518FII7_9PLAN|nr:cadherin domain-containing protein [Gimesia panareensis]QDV16090.1 Extracellular serine protease precursor [Gimesia panareensis]